MNDGDTAEEEGEGGGELASDTPHNPNGPTYCILLVPREAHVDVCVHTVYPVYLLP